MFENIQGKELEKKARIEAEFPIMYDNHEHIQNWELEGVFLGCELDKETKKGKVDFFYIYDPVVDKIYIINTKMITGQLKYGIKTGQLKIYDGVKIKYEGKKPSPMDPTKKYNDYSVVFYDKETIKSFPGIDGWKKYIKDIEIFKVFQENYDILTGKLDLPF